VAADSSGLVMVSTSSDGTGGAVEQILVFRNGVQQQTIGTGQPDMRDDKPSSAQFNGPFGLAWYEPSRTLYVADKYNHRIRSVTGL
jgi:hypothetical protein